MRHYYVYKTHTINGTGNEFSMKRIHRRLIQQMKTTILAILAAALCACSDDKAAVAENFKTEKGQNTDAILAKSDELFEAAEKRTAQIYERSEKGALSGQIFVATQGGRNVKFGARQVLLFSRDAIDILTTGLKTFAAAKLEQLQSDIATARIAEKTAEGQVKAAEEQAKAVQEQANAAVEQANAAVGQAKAIENQAQELYRQGADPGHRETAISAARAAVGQATEVLNAWRAYGSENTARAREAVFTASRAAFAARNQIEALEAKKAYYYSADFYFSHLGSAIQTAETDAEGKFTIPVPRRGEFVIAAQAERSVGSDTERYYWLQPVSLHGQDGGVQNLSNNNLTRTL